MAAQRMENGVSGRNHARGHGLHDHLIFTAEARRLQAEAMANGVHWLGAKVRRLVVRLMQRGRRTASRAANRNRAPITLGRASVGAALRPYLLRLQRLLRRSVLEPYARWRQRRIAVARLEALDDHLLADIGLTRGQVTAAVDDMIARPATTVTRPAGRGPAAEIRHEPALAA